MKAKKVTRTYAYLKGPKSEFGTPLPVSGVKGRIAKAKEAKLKVKIQAGALDPASTSSRSPPSARAAS